MTIEQAIKEYCLICPREQSFFVETDKNGCWNILVKFKSPMHSIEYEGIQFDILPAFFDYASGKCPKLVEFWKSFCKERKIKLNSVESICIVNGW